MKTKKTFAAHLNTLGSTKLSDADREDLDFYQTPEHATKTLVQHINFSGLIVWEPMAGNGMIADVLKKSGITTYATDVVQRKYKLDDVVDFFAISTFGAAGSDFAIVTNPPYKFADKFLLHALADLNPAVCCAFLPLRYLEGEKRFDMIYSRFKPSKLIIYAKRLGCFTEKDKAEGKVSEYGAPSAVGYMWICFERDKMLDTQAKADLVWVK